MINNIGLAYKANKLILGYENFIKIASTDKFKLIIIAKDCSNNTKKKIYKICEIQNIDVLEKFTSTDLSASLGKRNIKVISITDRGFANLIRSQGD